MSEQGLIDKLVEVLKTIQGMTPEERICVLKSALALNGKCATKNMSLDTAMNRQKHIQAKAVAAWQAAQKSKEYLDKLTPAVKAKSVPHSYIEESRREENGYIKQIQSCERIEDMSPDARLKLFREDDGDVIVSIIPAAERMGNAYGFGLEAMQAQFCSLASGGGRSPKTREALFALMQAIEEDNSDRPIELPK